MGKALAWLLVLVVVLAGSGTAYLRLKVRQLADRFVDSVQPVARITYDGIHTGLDGSIGIENVVIRPRGLPDEVRLDALIFHPPNPAFLWTAEESLKQWRIPEALGVTFHGVELRADGAILREFGAAGADLGSNPLAAQGCGELDRFGPAEMAAMGYERLLLDLRFDYRLLPDGNGARVQLHSATRAMATMEADAEVELAGLAGDLRNLGKVKPRLMGARIRYSDHGYNRRVAAFCAAEAGLTEAGFLDRHVDRIGDYLHELGAQPDESLLAAYRKFVEDSGELAVTLVPDQPVNPRELQFYRASDVVRLLRPVVTINGETLDVAPSRREVAKRTAAAAPAPLVRSSAPVSTGAGYQAIAPSELGQYQGHAVRIRLASGQALDGTVEGLRDNALLLKRRLHRGFITQPVALDQIAEVSVAK